MKCPNCGTELHDGARLCLECESFFEPTPEERARAIAHVVEHELAESKAQHLHPLKVEDSVDRAIRGLRQWTWLALASVVVLLLYFSGYI